METFLSTLYQRSSHLTFLGFIHLAAFFLFAVLSFIDQRTLLGVNVWLKPMKFAISIGIYALTMAWFMGYLPNGTGKSIIIWTIVVTMVIETACITLQAARGIQSHFNNSTPFNSSVFVLMGISIAINTFAVGAVLILSFQETTPSLAASYLWALRFGMAIFILASLEGFLMGAKLTHSVGAPDGTAGLPFLNWSRSVGDLRVMHFIGLHAIQVLPLIAYTLAKFLPEQATTVVVIFFSLFYGTCCILALVQALAGLPFESFTITPPHTS